MFKRDILTHTYFDKQTYMMLERDTNNHGMGDALARTSFAALAYCNAFLYIGIRKCIDDSKKKIKILRNPHHNGEDTSRDMVIIVLTTLFHIYFKPSAYFWGKRIPFRISKRYFQTPTMWCWIRALNGSKFWKFMYLLCEIPVLFIAVLISNIARHINKIKYYDPDYYIQIDPDKPFWDYDNKLKKWVFKKGVSSTGWIHAVNNGHKLYNKHLYMKQTRTFYRIVDRLILPGYSLLLSCLMYSCVPSKCVKKILLKAIPNSNLYMMQLLGETDKEANANYKPNTGWRWQNFADGRSYWYPLYNNDAIFNCIDKDILL